MKSSADSVLSRARLPQLNLQESLQSEGHRGEINNLKINDILCSSNISIIVLNINTFSDTVNFYCRQEAEPEAEGDDHEVSEDETQKERGKRSNL